jgi:riboflavin biosynthesis pyrimidine reductase
MGNLRANLLKQTKKAFEVAMIPLQVKKDKHEMNGWILKRETEIADLEAEIVIAQSEKKFNPDAILDAMDTLAVQKLRLEQGIALRKSMFEDEVADIQEEGKN